MKAKALFLVSMMGLAIALSALLSGCNNSGEVDRAESEPLGHAVWANIFDSVEEATDKADLVVLGEITSSEFGRTNEKEVRPTHYTYVTVSVQEVLKGEFARQELLLEMIGSRETIWFEGMPEFGVGERHLLFLRIKKDRRSEAGYVVMGPTARYKIENGKLSATSYAYELTKAMDGRPVEDVRVQIASSNSTGS